MSKYVLIRNGMRNAEEEDILHFPNEFIFQEGVLDISSMEVTQRSAGANMSVDVSGGRAYVKNDSWSTNSSAETKYWPVLNSDTTNVTITSNSSGNPRIDIIVCKVDSSITPDDDASNIMTIYAVAGTPAASPTAPSTPTNAFVLAQIAVASGATSIVTANITDGRPYANLYVRQNNPIYFQDPSDLSTLMYGGTNQTDTPTNDGWRFVRDQSYNGGSADFIVWEKTDGNQANPDGGYAWLLTGNDGVQEESLVITGDGYVEVHDGNPLRVYNSTDTEFFNVLVGSNTEFNITTGNLHVYDTDHDVHVRIYADDAGGDYLDLWHDGTNANIGTGSGGGDIYFDPNGGDIYFRSGCDISVWNNANTQRGYFAMGSNFDFVTTSGEITMNPAGTFRITAGDDIVFTPGGGDVFITAGSKLNLRNPADSAVTQLYTDSNDNYWMSVSANGNVVIFGKSPRRDHTTTSYQDSFEMHGWGYVNGDGTRAVTGSVTLPKASSSQNFIVVISAAGEKTGSVPTTSSDCTIGGVFSMQAKPTSTTTFSVNYFKSDAAGTTTAGTYGVFHWIAKATI